MRAPPSSPPANRPLRAAWTRDTLGLAGAYLFAFGAWLGVALAHLGLALMLIAAIWDAPRVWAWLRHSPWPVLMVLWCVTLVATLLVAWPRGNLEPPTHLSAAASLAKLWLFPLFAWYLRGERQRVWTALALALAGFVIGRLLAIDLDDPLRTPSFDTRPGFGLPTLAFAQYAATALIGLYLLAPRVLRAGSHLRRALGLAAWLTLVGLALLALLMAQARMVWMSTGAILIALSWAIRGRVADRRVVLALSILMIVAITLLSTRFERLGHEVETYALLLRGDWSEIGYGSAGLRFHAWGYGLELWLQRPWLGWGPGAARELLATHPDVHLHVLPHFHNIYVELAVGIGLLGGIPLAIGCVAVFRSIAAASRSGRLPAELCLFLAAGLALHLLVGMTNSRVVNSDWAFMWILLAGVATTTTSPHGNKGVTAA
ncbi:O-antigen ligase family protein [Rhodocyclaceae bacterium SMB388]